MFFTNMASDRLILATGMGAVSGRITKGGSALDSETAIDYLLDGEIDYDRLEKKEEPE